MPIGYLDLAGHVALQPYLATEPHYSGELKSVQISATKTKHSNRLLSCLRYVGCREQAHQSPLSGITSCYWDHILVCLPCHTASTNRVSVRQVVGKAEDGRAVVLERDTYDHDRINKSNGGAYIDSRFGSHKERGARRLNFRVAIERYFFTVRFL